MPQEAQSVWVSVPSWKERWRTTEELEGGGQGETFRASRISDGKLGFLKIIKSRKDKERRARFFREASAYDAFRIDGIPHLIESNAHQHNDDTTTPYIATQFIEGPTLRKWREGYASVSLETAVIIAQRLLDIVKSCHSAGCVHRDIKPDNIILEGCEPSRPYLLDFGLNYHDLPEIDFQTEDWQEVGNRFLRLPELSAGSRLKQDPRSDLSFVAGILFYLLTGDHPDVLQDADGRLPHQRPAALAKLQAIAGRHFSRLAALFDNCFGPVIASRYSDASTMSEGITKMMAEEREKGSADDDLASILAVLDTSVERQRVQTIKQLSDALHQVQAVFNEVQTSLGGTLILSQTNFNVDGAAGRNTLIWSRSGSKENLLSITYEFLPTGDELVLRMSGETVYRTSQANPDYGSTFRDKVRSVILARIRSVVSDPYALPPEADLFLEVKPHPTLEAAAKNAAKTNKHVLAFVFDPAQNERGRLHHGLMYFLQNRRTRDAMNAAFVTALVPLAQVASISDMLKDVSMEQSRWVVFDKMLNPIEQAVIYANPQEGERIVGNLAKRYPRPTLPPTSR